MSTNRTEARVEEIVEIKPGEEPEYGQPARAPTDSLWAEQEDVDFFLPPAISLETLEYLSFNGEGPLGALRERFGIATSGSENGGGENGSGAES